MIKLTMKHTYELKLNCITEFCWENVKDIKISITNILRASFYSNNLRALARAGFLFQAQLALLVYCIKFPYEQCMHWIREPRTRKTRTGKNCGESRRKYTMHFSIAMCLDVRMNFLENVTCV